MFFRISLSFYTEPTFLIRQDKKHYKIWLFNLKRVPLQPKT